MYLLVFDRDIAEETIKRKYPSEGPHFLEKIIQASFEIPLPLSDDLNSSILADIEATCGSPPEEQVVYFMNIFYDAVVPYIAMPRDVVRLASAIAVSWPPINGEVNIADFLAVETLRLFEPKLHSAIRAKKEDVCGIKQEGLGNAEDTDRILEALLRLVPSERRETVKTALLRLFPRLENVGYASEFITAWEAERRLCTRKYFDAYFRMTIGDESIPRSELDELIARCDDAEFIKDQFLKANQMVRKNGKSRGPATPRRTQHIRRQDSRQRSGTFGIGDI